MYTERNGSESEVPESMITVGLQLKTCFYIRAPSLGLGPRGEVLHRSPEGP